MTQAPARATRTGSVASRAALVRDGVWRVAEALATPLVPSDYLDLIDPMRSGADLRGRVVAVVPETTDAATVVIRPGRAWRGHVPGQYVRIGLDIDGVRHWRAYSVTSPRSGAVTRDARGAMTRHGDDTISITVKAIENGVVSNHVVRALRPGTTLFLDQAKGDFVVDPARLADDPGRGVLFITAGSGITPVMGMLRNHLALEAPEEVSREHAPDGALADVVVLHSAPTADDVIFAEELRSLADEAHIRLTVRHTDHEGMLELAELDEAVPDWRERAAYVCGPTGLLDAAEAHWEHHDLTDSLVVERFRPSIVDPGEGGEVTFRGSDVTVAADGSTPILDAGEAAGVLLPSGCRMGICFGCVSSLTSGAVRDLRTGEMSVVEDADEPLRIQTCISAAAGPCEIDR